MDDDVHFDPSSLTQAARDTFTVRRVFGEAYERDGVLVVPVARVTGVTGSGAAGGESEAPPWVAGQLGRRRPAPTPLEEAPDAPVSAPERSDAADRRPSGRGSGHGGGGGFGTRVRPLGVYVVDADGVHWRPAVDVNRAIMGAQLMAGWVLSVGFLSWALGRRRH